MYWIMEKQILDIKVHVEDDYVYLSTEDWLKLANVLSNISYDWSVNEDRESYSELLISEKVH